MGPGCRRKGNLRPPTSCPQGQLGLWIPELSAGSGRCRNRSTQKGSCSFHPKRKGSGGRGSGRKLRDKERLKEGQRKVSLGPWGAWVATLFTPVRSFRQESWGEVPNIHFYLTKL